MEPMAKILMFGGAALVLLGVIVWALSRLGFHGMPGDIAIRGEHGAFYFPIVSCILLSILLTFGMWLWHWLSGR